MRAALTFLAAAALGFAAAASLRPAGEAAPFARGAPAGDFVVEGEVPDAYGRPPGVPRNARAGDFPQPPPWAVVLWRDRRGRWCHEAGTLVSDETPGRGDQLPGVPATESTFPRPLVGSMRPDAKSGTGIQFYDVGRFLGYPLQEGGSCGDPEAGPGLIVSLEHRFARRDLGPDRTVVSGIAGSRVRSVAVGGRAVRLGRRRSFLALYDGLRYPDVEVRYVDGSRKTLRFSGRSDGSQETSSQKRALDARIRESVFPEQIRIAPSGLFRLTRTARPQPTSRPRARAHQ